MIMNKKITAFLLSCFCMTALHAAVAEAPYQPTEEERELANSVIENGNYRIYTEVSGSKYYLQSQSNRQVIFTTDKSAASEYNFELRETTGKFAPQGWRINYNDQFRFSNGSNSATNGQTYLSMAESKNDRDDFERQVVYAKADGDEYVFAFRATNATSSDETVWQAWSKNCYWTVNTSAELPYPCYDVENPGKASFVWKIESTKEQYAAYDLNSISADEFLSNPTADGLWKFEKFNYATGKYTLFTECSDSSAANYVDIYQPCRVGGERVVEIEGLTEWSNDNTFAAITRKAWTDYPVYNVDGTRNNSKERFAYVAYDQKLGFEVYANDEYASVISFVIPKDGFYQVDATMVRQDLPAGRGQLALVPRFRYKNSKDPDSASPKFGLAFLTFGQEGAEIAGYTGNAHISNGGEQRYEAQIPEDLSFAFEAKAGDIVSMEVNTDSTHVFSNWARDYYGRAFYKKLEITQVNESAAKQNANFADTYGESADLETLKTMIDECSDFLADCDYGTAFGQYSEEIATQVDEMLGEIYDALENDQIHAYNATGYLQELKEAWAAFLSSKVDIDYTAEGNYMLINTDPLSGATVTDPEVMAVNTDSPWGFYYYEVEKGTYTRFPNHDTGSKYGNAEVNAWYKGTGDWLYIADNGDVHPMTNLAPAIMFTAPEDGVYKVDFGCYRPNPNANVENPLWIRSRFMKAGTETLDKESFMYAKEYGSVANDGQGGRAPITMDYYVNMKKGDKITWEIDCYTSGRNSSAGTLFTRLSVAKGIDAESPYTLENVPEGADLFDAYSMGDPTQLIAAISEAQAAYDSCKDNLGTEGGQYSSEIASQLVAEIEAAGQMVDAGDTQYNMDQKMLALNALAKSLLESRLPYEIFIEGTYSVQLVDTEKYLTQKNKNSNGSNYYAAFADIAAVQADATKNGVELSDYNWTFNFKKITKKVPTGEYDEATGDDITVDVEQTSIYNANGYVSELGYVIESSDETQAPAFRFFKQNLEDETFAIMNQSGAYWNGSFAWKSPYDQVNTTATPNYIFVLSDMTIDTATGIGTISAEGNAVVGTQYYSLSGMLLNAPQKGIVLKVQNMADGTKKTTKVLVK